ncbi:hypothetical protein EXU48_01585 [Occultella glacieicola]|uniref:Uncharacterized protein n=1 Tax=Occultella glacieicola TaxID=2518684 RepID=A0ABY2E8V1_9MICO|nr:hypothetical protein [Occultella glacieicola]TDE98912.1 hypothetical protein EXU48_01585 [Occultella glacieicola]
MNATNDRWRTVLAATAAAVALCAASVLTAAPAAAAGNVTIDSDLGAAQVSLTGPTTVSVTGSGFQSVQNGFGGVYVLFGWVSDPGGGSWRPSEGGHTGDTYLYVPDTEAMDNDGYQRFVSFPGSSTDSAANGGLLAADGTFSLSMVIPGPTFTAQDRDGNAANVDCREVGCGIITVGAHGVVNANNESFTPVTFIDTSGSPGTSGTGGTDAATEPTAAGVTDTETPVAGADETTVTTGPATIGVDQTAVVQGRVVGFTGQGFTPGEQVLVTLAGGLAAAGPYTAGQFGEVAGTLALPTDIRLGSHVLRMSGAGSGQAPEITLTVMPDPNAAPPLAQGPPGLSWAFLAVVIVGAVLLALILSSLIAALVRRRRRKRGAAAAAPVAGSGSEVPMGPAPGAGGTSTAAVSRTDETSVLAPAGRTNSRREVGV